MSRFTTRVELYGEPSFDTYKALHAAMAKANFSRQVQLGTKWYSLPNAEYTCDGASPTSTIRDLAVKAAATVWKDFGVMVTRTEVAREYHNLKPV